MITPPAYPARPISGGPFNLAPEKFGDWAYELKYNGWRALVHGPTGQMFNRHLKPLSIQSEFTETLKKLAEASLVESVEWWDCEALERRHDFARGSLIVLDAAVPGVSYAERQEILSSLFRPLDYAGMKSNQLCRTVSADGGALWEAVPRLNKIWPELVEGIVAKRLDSEYPFQLRRAEQEFPFWLKHRIHY